MSASPRQHPTPSEWLRSVSPISRPEPFFLCKKIADLCTGNPPVPEKASYFRWRPGRVKSRKTRAVYTLSKTVRSFETKYGIPPLRA